jgi:starch phosphorylase
LEREVIPAFYSRDQHGIPTAWVARMRESMARLTPQFSANHAVRQYTEQYYLPAAASYCRRAAEKGALGAQLQNWRQHLAQHWPKVHFGDIWIETSGGQHLFQVQVYLDDMHPDAVRVELYAEAPNGAAPERQVMRRGSPLVGALHGYIYRACVAASRPARDYTPRVIPGHPAAAIPLEAAQILWQR